MISETVVSRANYGARHLVIVAYFKAVLTNMVGFTCFTGAVI